MSRRQWGVLGLLVLLNGFIFTLLFLLLQQVYFKPTTVATATPAVTKTPPPTATFTATFTATIPPVPTPTFTAVVTPSPTATITPTPTATFTPGPPTPTATPTGTPIPAFEFYYTGTMASAPNCGTVYMEGKVVDKNDTPINGVTVRLQFFDNFVYRLSGDGKPAGEWGFAPLAGSLYHAPMTFTIQLVQSQSDPTPRSNPVTIGFPGCDKAGQFTNIIFKQRQ